MVVRRREASILSDGAPVWLPWAEAWLVGAAFWAAPDDIQIASIDVQPEDFRDETLGLIWRACLDLDVVSIATVCAYLLERCEQCRGMCEFSDRGFSLKHGNLLDYIGGEPRIVELATAPSAFMYAGPVSMLAHAEVVKDWSERRTGVMQAQEDAQAAYEGRGQLRVVRPDGLKSAFD